MNNLKFRVWDKSRNCFTVQKFITIDGVECNFGDFLIDLDGKPRFLNYDHPDFDPDAVVQKFTGLIDCTGKYIYEGDIVIVRCYDDWDDNVGFDVIYNVAWSDIHCGWRGFTKNMIAGKHAGSGMHQPIKVIGNIFETTNI